MKKLLPFLFFNLLFSVYSVIAQTVILSQDFQSGALPSSWSQTSLALDGGWKFGSSTTLSSISFTIPSHTNIAATNDERCGQTCNKSADRLISPLFSLSGITSAFLSADIFFLARTFQSHTEIGTVEISIDGGISWIVFQTLAGFADW